MKNLTNQAGNKLNLAGKLMDVQFGEGKTKETNQPYKNARVTIRVTQPVNGKEETSDIQVSMFATELTSTGKPNPAWKSINDLALMKTAQNVGIDDADKCIDSWQIRGSFINEAKVADVASFVTDIVILKMTEEIVNDEPTGRLIVRGGIVQYGGRLDVVDFIVEAPDSVEYISRNWEVNGTVTVKGRIRVSSMEEEVQTATWGEDIPETTTRFIRELIITTGDSACKEEDFAYDPVEINKAYQERKAAIEQAQIDAAKRAPKQGTNNISSAEASGQKYGWE